MSGEAERVPDVECPNCESMNTRAWRDMDDDVIVHCKDCRKLNKIRT